MIARINLLPWRQRRRERRRRVFLGQLGGVTVGAVILALLTGAVLDGRISGQNARNQALLEAVGENARRLDEVETVRRHTEATLGRLRSLQALHRDRAATVRTFDELVRTVVPGVHYTSLIQRRSVITARGIARSNNDIAVLMRNLKDSERFEQPRLKRIDEVGEAQGTEQAAVFELTFATAVPHPRTAGR